MNIITNIQWFEQFKPQIQLQYRHGVPSYKQWWGNLFASILFMVLKALQTLSSHHIKTPQHYKT